MCNYNFQKSAIVRKSVNLRKKMPNFLKSYMNGEIRQPQNLNIDSLQKKKYVGYIRLVSNSKIRFRTTQLL